MRLSKENTSDNQRTLGSLNVAQNQKNFLKYYEDNIQLRKQLDIKNSKINELKDKLNQQISLNKTTNPYSELKQLKQQTKKPSVSSSFRHTSSGKKSAMNMNMSKADGIQGKKVENLLEIIDHYKNKLLLAEQEAANLRRQKQLLQQDVNLKDRRIHQDNNAQSSLNQSNYGNKSYARQQDLSIKLKQKIGQLQLQKERNKFSAAEIKRLQARLRTLDTNQDELSDLKIQNRIWQERVMKLTLLNSDSTGNHDIRATEEKARQLQIKLKSGIEKYEALKEKNMKLEAQHKLLQNRLIEVTYSEQELQKDNLRLKANEINNPIIQKLIQDPELLAQVVGEISKPKSRIQNSSHIKQSAQTLIMEKQLLARRLLQAQQRIKAMQDNWKQKQALLRIQKQEMMNKMSTIPINSQTNKKIFTSKAGISYDGDISMFTEQNTKIPSGINYFDIFLSELSLIENIVRSVAGLSSVTNPLILATVDFYNFNTVNTKLTQGYGLNLHSEFNFRIVEDEFFYKYLHKGLLKIQIWASEGNKNFNLGKVEIPLKSLFMRSKPKISPVLNTSAPIYLGQKIMGTLQFDMRMRAPIHEQTSKILDLAHILPQDDVGTKRKLIVQIQDGFGFSQKSNIFVYYPFRMQDFYTKTSKGPCPKWSHYKMFEVFYNTDLKNYLRRSDIQFTLFDDNAVLYDQKETDVLGSGSIPLVSLLEDKSLKERLQIRKNGVKVGSIDVKVFWYQSKEQKDNSNKAGGMTAQDYMTSLHQDIKRYLTQKNSNPQAQFRKIDNNGTGMISFDEFNVWVTKLKQTHKYSQQLIGKFYDSFKQPVNLINWLSRMSQKQQSQKHSEDLITQFSQINKMLHSNSAQIGSHISLADYLKDKDLFQVSLDIDIDRNGSISKNQLMKYMTSHNIHITEEQMGSTDQVKIVDFLKKYSTQQK